MALIALVVLVALGAVIAYLSDSSTLEKQPSSVIADYTNTKCLANGVTVVVDFGTSSSLKPLVRCANGFAGSGWEIFQATDLNVVGTNQYPIGFVCKIESFPDSQDCKDTPSYSEGSWGYFQLVDESGWRVSGVGPASYMPKCGAIEGWRFLEPGESVGDNLPRVEVAVVNCD